MAASLPVQPLLFRLPKFCENFHLKRALVIGTNGIPFKEFFLMKLEDFLLFCLFKHFFSLIL